MNVSGAIFMLERGGTYDCGPFHLPRLLDQGLQHDGKDDHAPIESPWDILWAEPFAVSLYCVIVQRLLMYDCEKSSFCAEDVSLLEVFDQRFFGSIAGIEWNDRESNVDITNIVLDTGSENALPQRTHLASVRLFGLILCITNKCSPYSALFSAPPTGIEVTDGVSRYHLNFMCAQLMVPRPFLPRQPPSVAPWMVIIIVQR